jgi:hypothetical protein
VKTAEMFVQILHFDHGHVGSALMRDLKMARG